MITWLSTLSVKKVLLVVVITVVGCGAISLASSVFYAGTISGFTSITSSKIPETYYSFIVEPVPQDNRKLFFLQNESSRIKVEVVEGPEAELQYALLKHQSGLYLIVKRP